MADPDDAPSHRGRCLCGSVRFVAAGDPLWVACCHCDSCRRATGGALVVYCGFARDHVRFEGRPLHRYGSSPGVERTFCDACGTSLAYEGARWPGEIHLIATAFEDPPSYVPRVHVYAGEQLPWLRLADGLPRYQTTSSAGAPMDEPVATAAAPAGDE